MCMQGLPLVGEFPLGSGLCYCTTVDKRDLPVICDVGYILLHRPLMPPGGGGSGAGGVPQGAEDPPAPKPMKKPDKKLIGTRPNRAYAQMKLGQKAGEGDYMAMS